MKNFKEYILQEDIVNAITNIITKHYKNGNVHATLQNSEIEDALNIWKDSNPNWKEEDIAGLYKEVNGKKVFDKEKIRNKINKVNKLKEVKKAFGGQAGKFETLALNNKFEQLKTELAKVKKQYSDNKEVINAANKLNKIATSFPVAASVMTEDDNEEKLKQDLINAAHDLDEIIKGVRLVGGESGIDKENAQAAAKQILKVLIDKLGTNTKFLIPATKFLTSAAKNGNAKILTAEELEANFKSASKNMSVIGSVKFTSKEFTSPLFKTSLIVCFGMLLLKKLVKSKEFTLEGISKESEFSNFQALNDVSAELNAINIDDKIVNAIGKTDIETSETFIPAIEKFINKLYKTTEREVAQNSNHEDTAKANLKTNSSDNNSSDNSSSENSSDNSSDNSSSENSSRNGIWNPIKELTIKSNKQEVLAAIDEFFGASEENPGKVFNQVLGHMNKAKADNDKLYKYSKHEEDNQIKEAFGDNLKIAKAKLGNLSPTIGRFKTGSSELNGGEKNGIDLSWEHYIDELEKLRKAYKSKAEQIAANFIDKIVSIPKKSDYLVKLKKLSSDFESTMYDVYAKAKKRNSYSELGKIGHDLRNDYHDIKEKAKKKYEESKMGQIEAITRNALNEKIQPLTVETLEKNIPEDWRDVFSYAIMHQDDTNALREKDVTSDTNLTVMKAFISALSLNKDVFGVADEREAIMFMDIFFKTKIKEDKAIKDWVYKYNQTYESQKGMADIGPTNVGKFWTKIATDLANAANPIELVKNKLGVSSLDLNKGQEMAANIANAGNTIEPENAKVSSIKTEEKILSFKDYYMLNEGLFNKKANVTEDDSKAYALLCALACIGGTQNKELMALKQDALNKLSVRDKRLGTAEVEKVLKQQLTNSKVSKYVNEFDKLVSRQPAGTVVKPTSTTQQTTQNNQNAVKPTAETMNTNPIKLGQQPVVNNVNPNGSVQTSVTTGAVGDYVIPDRLTKQIMRRRIKSFM